MTLSRELRRLLYGRSGTVAPLFGLALMVLLFAAGLAVDASRAYRTDTQIGGALDAAALATAKALRLQGLSDSELTALAAKYFEENLHTLGNREATYAPPTLAADRDKSSVTLTVLAHLPTTIGKLMGVEKFDMPKSATAIYEIKDVELGMMLDVSGSMAGTKISDLKAAAGDLVTLILNGNKSGAKNRIGIAPYSTAVNAGEFAKAAKGGGGDAAKDTCVSERPGSHAYTDSDPSHGPLGKKASWCPASDVVPLTDDENVLKSKVDAFEAGGSTAGHLGIAWAWYIVSPNWASFWPSASEPKPYNDLETLKAVVIMTDGEFNKSYESGNGNSKDQAERLCDNMKDEGVTIFSVAFDAPSEALPVLQNCASSSQHFFNAKDGATLRAVFQDIGRRLTALRLAS